MTLPPTAPMALARLAELRKEPAQVLLQFHMTPPMTCARAALQAQYVQLEEALLALSVELGEA